MRKVIQISNSITHGSEISHVYGSLVALCDDGTMWEHLRGFDKVWTQLPPIPQPEIVDEVVIPKVGDAILVTFGFGDKKTYPAICCEIVEGFIIDEEVNSFKYWKFNLNDHWRDASGNIVEL